jgi:hypothetical protein
MRVLFYLEHLSEKPLMATRRYNIPIHQNVSKRYASDLNDQEFGLIAPHVAQKSGSGKKRREVLNAIFYRVRTGCQWRMLLAESLRDFVLWPSLLFAVPLCLVGVSLWLRPATQWPSMRVAYLLFALGLLGLPIHGGWPPPHTPYTSEDSYQNLFIVNSCSAYWRYRFGSAVLQQRFGIDRIVVTSILNVEPRLGVRAEQGVAAERLDRGDFPVQKR